MDYATTLNIDQQGRIIIPAKVRKALQLHTGDVLMLEADTRNICLRKCDSHIPMDIRLDSFLDILHSNVPCRILLCNDSKIIASKNYHTALNMPVTESIQRLLQQGKMKLFSEKERIYPTMTGKYPISVFSLFLKKTNLVKRWVFYYVQKPTAFQRNGFRLCQNDCGGDFPLHPTKL